MMSNSYSVHQVNAFITNNPSELFTLLKKRMLVKKLLENDFKKFIQDNYTSIKYNGKRFLFVFKNEQEEIENDIKKAKEEWNKLIGNDSNKKTVDKTNKRTIDDAMFDDLKTFRNVMSEFFQMSFASGEQMDPLQMMYFHEKLQTLFQEKPAKTAKTSNGEDKQLDKTAKTSNGEDKQLDKPAETSNGEDTATLQAGKPGTSEHAGDNDSGDEEDEDSSLEDSGPEFVEQE